MWLGLTAGVPFSPQRCHGTFRWWLEYSGGKMTDWGAHHVDIAQWALGVENTGPVEIAGEGTFQLDRAATLAMITGKKPPSSLPNGYNTPVTFNVTLRYANGNTLIIKHGPGNGIDIQGGKGALFVSRKELTGKTVEAIAADGNASARLNDAVISLYRGKEPSSHMKDFIDCVRERKQPVSDVFTHHRSVSSCHLANMALLLSRKLRWDPKKEDFRGDSQASSMRSRQQRKPYTLGG